MDFIINGDELAALCGLPHLQQLAYLRGIRPYMDVKTGLVGVKRRISHQSIAEQLYIEAHPGIKSENFSRAQARRALTGLERAGVIINQSKDLQLILKCSLATRDYSVQNKAVTNPSQQVVTATNSQLIEIQKDYCSKSQKADMGKMAKADTPLKEKNYIYLLSQFEQFWLSYPQMKSREQAWQVFQRLNPDNALINTIMQALTTQIQHREHQQLQGLWVPPWKYPANWLTNQCWNDELNRDQIQEIKHASRQKNTRNESSKDMFWIPDESADEKLKTNVIPFKRCK